MRNVEFTGVILAATCGQRLFPLTQAVNKSHDNCDSDNDSDNDNDNDNDIITTNNSYSNNNDSLDDTWHRSEEETHNHDHYHDHDHDQKNGAGPSTIKNTRYMPKHLLPLAGRPIIHHLLEHCIGVGMERIIIAIGADDHQVTKSSLVQMGCATDTDTDTCNDTGTPRTTGTTSTTPSPRQETNTNEESAPDPTDIQSDTTEFKYGHTSITVIVMPKECNGSADAMRCIIAANIIESQSHVMVMPADLVLYGNMTDAATASASASASATATASNDNNVGDPEQDHVIVDALGSLADVHRREYRVGVEKGMPLGMSLLLADVGEEDESGVPLKESSKAKKGGIAREVGDIEYIGISTIGNKNRPPTQRIILKQSKYSVEDIENTGATPKLHIPKARLHKASNQVHMTTLIKTAWSDLHVYCFSPWVLNVLVVKKNMKDLDKDLIPFLVSRQFRGLKACFRVMMKGGKGQKKVSSSSVYEDKFKKGSDCTSKEKVEEEKEAMEALTRTMRDLNFFKDGGEDGDDDVGDANYDCDVDSDDNYPFLVCAKVLSREYSKLSLRASTLPAYTYACREVVAQAIAASKTVDEKELKIGPGTGAGTITGRDLGTLYLPENTSVNTKFNTITLPEANIGEKVQIKSSTIGRGVVIGRGCRLNNVVVHDNVTIGENCILQNSNISQGSIIGSNCNLNDCQVGLNAEVPTGTKAKGDSF